jgi:hypothetical protein
MRRIQKISDEDRLKKVCEVLDEDKDGIINVEDVLKVSLRFDFGFSNIGNGYVSKSLVDETSPEIPVIPEIPEFKKNYFLKFNKNKILFFLMLAPIILKVHIWGNIQIISWGENPVALHLGFTFCLLPMGIFHRKKSGNLLNSEFHP